MTIQKTFQLLISQLETIYHKGEAESIGYLLMEHFTGKEKMQIRREPGMEIPASIQLQVEEALNQLLQHRPVQYVIGEAWFGNLKFFVDENVLIPRPETEELVHWILKTDKSKSENLKILEIGTGSGCIAISLKNELPAATVSAVDISEEALVVAKKNAASLNTSIAFSGNDFLDEKSWQQYGQFDIIVSNPPYIPVNEKEKLEANVAAWEPSTALFVPDSDPLLFYRKIAVFGKSHLQKGGEIFVECHQDYAASTKNLFEDYGYTAELKKDIFENERMLRAVLGES